jgi:hypothetical protein
MRRRSWVCVLGRAMKEERAVHITGMEEEQRRRLRSVVALMLAEALSYTGAAATGEQTA